MSPSHAHPADPPLPRWAGPALAAGAATIGFTVLSARAGGPGVAVMVAVFVASLTSSVGGFAFSAICGAMLFHIWDNPVEVVQVMMACSIANQAMMVWSLRRDVAWADVRGFLAGGALGMPVGVWALLHADKRLYLHALGILLLAYGGWMLAGKARTVRRQHIGFDLLAGLVGGATGGAAAFPGAPVSIWCSLKGWDKVRQRAAFQPFILAVQAAALLAVTVLRQQAGQGMGFNSANLLCVPAGLCGTWLGVAYFRRMSNRQFAVTLNVLLIVSGLSYVM